MQWSADEVFVLLDENSYTTKRVGFTPLNQETFLRVSDRTHFMQQNQTSIMVSAAVAASDSSKPLLMFIKDRVKVNSWISSKETSHRDDQFDAELFPYILSQVNLESIKPWN